MVYWGFLLKIKCRIRSWSLVTTPQNIGRFNLTAVCGNSGYRWELSKFVSNTQNYYGRYYFVVWPLLPSQCRCRELLLHLTAFSDTHTHTHTHICTLCKTLLDEWSARCRDINLLTHNIHKRETSMPPARFETAFPAGEGADLFLRMRGHRNRSGRDNTSK